MAASPIPESVSAFLHSRAQSKLHGKKATENDTDQENQLFSALCSLARSARLKLDGRKALDVAILFPGAAKEILSQDDVIPVSELVAILPALFEIYSNEPQSREDIRLLALHGVCAESLLSSVPGAVPFTLCHREDILGDMLFCYNSLGRSSKILAGGKWNLQDTDAEQWKLDLVRAKLTMLSIIKIIFDSISPGTEDSTDMLVGLAFTLLKDGANFPEGGTTPFVDRGLASDFENLFHLSDMLSDVARSGNDDPRIDAILQMIHTLPGVGDRSPGGLNLLRPAGTPFVFALPTNSRPPAAVAEPAINLKGKGKAPAPQDDPPELKAQIAEVQAVLPDIHTDVIRRCLVDPRYAGDISGVIEVLLDGGPPPEPELSTAPSTLKTTREPVRQSLEYTSQRQNVFDSDDFDLSRLRTGKQPVAGTAADAGLKAEILRRVAELELEDDSDEDVDDDFDIDDLDPSSQAAPAPKVTNAGDEEEDDDDDDAEDEAQQKPKPTNVETILELAYLKDQDLFLRTAEVRRSPARVELRKVTGWSDEQIEGWKIMLERNPKKDKILQKHEFRGNRAEPLPEVSVLASPRGRGRGRGRGGQARGGGQSEGGGRGDTGDRSQRTRDGKHKAQAGNHNRKRGHDKKMARGGAFT